MISTCLNTALSRQSLTRGSCSILRISHRCYSSAPHDRSRVLRLVLLGSGASCLSVGGAVAYGCYDPRFRNSLESIVPASSSLFSALLGEKFLPMPPPKLDSRLPSKLPPLPIPADNSFSVPSVPPEPVAPRLEPVPAPAAEKPESRGEPVAPAPIPPPPQPRLSLEELSAAALTGVHEAIVAQQRAMSATSDHDELVWRSMSDEDNSVTQQDLSQSSFLKNQLCDSADEVARIARKNLHALNEAIVESEKGSGPSDSATLIDAKQTLAKARSILHMARRTRLPADASVERAPRAGDVVTAERGALQLEYNRQIRIYQEELDGQLRQQLRRQIAAHCDHLKDELAAQRAELERLHRSNVEERLHEQRLALDASRADMLGHVEGLHLALNERLHLDKVALYSQRMWTACQTLYDTAVNQTATSAGETDNQRIPIAQHVQLVRKTADSGDVLVRTVLEALPEEAVSVGLVSQAELRRRFLRLERVCRRVALIGEKGGSLYKYAVSFLHSFLVIDAYTPAGDSLYSEVISDSLDTFGLVARAKEAMRLGDLELAVRYMGQLQGEPLRAASDWLSDSRHLLEVRQAAEAIMAHVGAEATGSTVNKL